MHIFNYPQRFLLENGQELNGFQLSYYTWGNPNSSKPVIWVCHALTANANVAEWWSGIFGEGKLLDPTKYHIICANMLGSCYGSTHALSENPQSQEPYFYNFPQLTNRDIVAAFDLLRQHLGIQSIHFALGGSLGGQQLMEWAFLQPNLFERLFLIATNAKHSAWGIAFNESQRMAICADGSWGQKNARAGLSGMGAARAMALLSYRHYKAYEQTQNETNSNKLSDFKAVTYQQHQAQKLIKRFDAFTYITLSMAMDSHHLGRGRESIENALNSIRAKTLVMGISSDVLFPVSEQRFLAEHLPNAAYMEIESDFGHDGFLLEYEAITKACYSHFSDL
ncbi:MAG: homoserine O-acetyltransferase [Cytophagales bacterium]|nr:MAG: homoserine O-acetyltransferase [Cytophagales bacterium]TAF59822.1 MAG: homoserine O-acetyltransferase [Cytophagales bacterium]